MAKTNNRHVCNIGMKCFTKDVSKIFFCNFGSFNFSNYATKAYDDILFNALVTLGEARKCLHI